MWIRSQDKTKLKKVNEIFIDREEIYDKQRSIFVPFNEKSDYNIIGYQYHINDLGTYSSKEKALKVLDYIETFLNEGTSGIFQMPQENQVK